MSDYYSDYYDYEGYEAKTNDPGPWMLIGVCLYSVLCVVLLPLLVMWGNRREKRRVDKEEWNRVEMSGSVEDPESTMDETKEGIEHTDAIETEFVESRNGDRINKNILESTKVRAMSSKRANTNVIATGTLNNGSRINFEPNGLNAHPNSALGGHTSAISAHSSAISSRSKRHRGKGRVNYANLYSRASESEEMHDYTHGTILHDRNYFRENGTKPQSIRDDESVAYTVDNLRPEDAADANDPGKGPILYEEQDEEEEMTICCGPNAMLAKRNLRYYYGVVADIAHIDRETKRLIQLGWPMTLSAAIGALFEAISVAVVANYLGTSELTAFVVARLMIGLTDTFMAGPSDALNTVCAHAIGAGNDTLAGQYVQIAAALYLIMGVPLLGVWYVWIADVARLMGLSDQVVGVIGEYTRVVVWVYLMSGLFEGYNSLLDITGYASVGAIVDVVYGFVGTSVLWLACVYWDDMNLYWVAMIELIVSVLFFIGFTIIVACGGWLNRFAKGMLQTCAIRNISAVKNVVATSIPLSFGSLLEYGEWEILTFFVAYLGDAEVAAWGLLESLWDFFEAATEGLGEASSIRLAYHLGKGNITMAKMCAFKSLFMGTCLSFFITALLFIMGQDLPTWFTPDETLQGMLNKLIPMIGVANIFMIFGMVSWTLIGAQGRYRLATTISLCMSFFVTLPIAALFTFHFVFDLQAIVGAIICGYSTTGLCLGYILLRSDWEHISETIREYNAENDLSESESDSESDSDSDCSYSDEE